VGLLAWALLPLSVGSLNNGQPNALVAGCLLFATAAMVRERWAVAGICLAVPVLFKVYPIAAVLLFMLVHPQRLGWRTGLAIAVGCLLPFLFQDPDYVTQVYQSWVHQVSNDNRRNFPLQYSYRDFHTLTRVVGLPMADVPYGLLQLAMATLVAGIVLRGHRQGLSPQQHLRTAFDLGCCWMILFGPATENSTYAVLAPTLALAAWESLQAGQPVWKRCWMMGILSLFVVGGAATAASLGRSINFVVMPAGALLLFAERLLSLCHPAWQLAASSGETRPLAPAA
jgi:hypothetical protein